MLTAAVYWNEMLRQGCNNCSATVQIPGDSRATPENLCRTGSAMAAQTITLATNNRYTEPVQQCRCRHIGLNELAGEIATRANERVFMDRNIQPT